MNTDIRVHPCSSVVSIPEASAMFETTIAGSLPKPRVARRAEHAVAAVEAHRRRSGRGQARRDAAGDQAAGGRRHRHRLRRRAVAPALRARVPGERRRHRLRPARRDGHPQQPLQGDGADGHRPAAPARPRARDRGAAGARAHHAQAEVHPAGTDDDRRYDRRYALRRPRGAGDGIRRAAEPGGARAGGRRRRCDPVR